MDIQLCDECARVLNHKSNTSPALRDSRLGRMRPLHISHPRIVAGSQRNGKLLFSAHLTEPQLRSRGPLFDNGVRLLHLHARLAGSLVEVMLFHKPKSVSEDPVSSARSRTYLANSLSKFRPVNATIPMMCV